MGADRGRDGGRGLIRRGNLLYGADALVGEWVARRIAGYAATPDTRAIGIVHGDALVAGAAFDRYNGIHIEACIAAKPGAPWATRATLRGLFAYPFIQLGCVAVTVLVPSTNAESLNLATKLGFRPEALVKYAAHDGSTLVVLKMLRDQCRWV